MSTHDLVALIAASNGGTTGTAGQGFLNNVTPVGTTGRSMASYLTTGWTLANQLPDANTTYSDGQTFNITIATSGGSRFGLILRTGNVINTAPAIAPYGFNAVTSTSAIASDGTGSVTVAVSAPYSTNVTMSYTSGWTGGVAPTNSNPASVTMQAILNGVSLGAAQRCGFQISFNPNAGGFSTVLNQEYDFNMNNRYETAAQWDWQWFSDSTYTTLLSSSQTYVFNSSPATSYTVYLRGRRTGTTPWNNYGACGWTDPRSAV